MILSAKGTLRETDFVTAQFLHIKPRPLFAVLGLIILALFIWVSFYAPSVSFFAWLGLLVAYFALYLPWCAKRNYRNYKAAHQPITIDVLDDGIHVTTENGAAHIPWDHILKWRRNSTLIVFYSSPVLFHIVPGRFFENEEEIEVLATLLGEKVGCAT